MADEYIDTGVPFLRSQDIKPFTIREKGLLRIGPDFHRRLSKSMLRAGDVVVVRTGYPGTAAVVPAHLDGANCADLVIMTPSNELNPHVLAGVFNSTWGRAAVGGNLVGSAQQHFNIGSAKALRIRLPDRRTQDRIAHVLCALHDLLENNRRRIELLKEMAQAIYQEWFVRLRYPGYENDQLIDSFLGAIPSTWLVSTVGTEARNFDRARRPLSGKERRERPGPYIYYGAAKPLDLIDGYLFDGDYLLVAEDGSVITTDGFPVIQRVRGKFWVNNHAHILQGGERISTTYLQRVLERYPIAGHVTGAAQPKVTQANLNRIPILVPPRSIILAEAGTTEPMVQQLFALDEMNVHLRQIRDLLLPGLVSGQIDVSKLDLDALLEEAVG